MTEDDVDVAVTNGHLVDLATNDVIDDAVLLMRDGKVAQIGRQGSVGLPDGVQTLDAGGGWILPGLINLHGHFSFDAGLSPAESVRTEPLVLTAIRAAGHALEALRSGVTTVRELASIAGLNIELRDAIARGYVAGPRIVACGQAITWTGGLGADGGAREADGPEEVRKAVREEVKHGADIIKLFATGGISTPRDRPGALGLTVDEMRAAVEEAHRAGIKATVHATTTIGVRDAVEAGVDCVEHGIGLDEATAEAMARRGVPLVSTLAVHQVLLRTPGGDPRIDAYKARAVGRPAARKASFQRAVAAGVRIGAGSDSGTVLNRHDDFVTELEQMVDAGVSCVDALRAATVWAAEILSSREVGNFSPGAWADVVVTAKDPRSDVRALRDIGLVVKGGKVVLAKSVHLA